LKFKLYNQFRSNITLPALFWNFSIKTRIWLALCINQHEFLTSLWFLIDFTPAVNFINKLRTPFLYESKLRSFLYFSFSFVIFGPKILYEKSAHTMLMKLTTGMSNSIWLTGCTKIFKNLGENHRVAAFEKLIPWIWFSLKCVE